MGYRKLTSQVMVNISTRWLDPEEDRKVFASLPLLAPLLPALEEVHQGLLTTQVRASAIQLRITVLMDRSTLLAMRHDTKLRATYNYLTSLAELEDDPEVAAALLDLRDRLIPVGLMAVTRSYTDKAGDAKLLPSRLDEASTTLLKSLNTAQGPLSDAVDAWTSAALELEKIDEERRQLTLELATDETVITPRDVIKAQNAWIRVIRTIESNLKLDKMATPEMIEQLLWHLRNEEAKTDRRAATSPKTNGTPIESAVQSTVAATVA